MKKDKIIIFLKKYKWFLLAILVVIYSFYWFEYKPKQIISRCEKETEIKFNEIKAEGFSGMSTQDIQVANDLLFHRCLRAHGIR